MNQSLQHHSNEELSTNLQRICAKEREIISEVILYLHEIDRRGYYRDLGFSSLFSYCVTGLGYSEGSAQRRIQAARALTKNPEIYTMLRDGKLTLAAVGELVPVITRQNKTELLSKAVGKSKAEVQSLTAQYVDPVPAKPKGTIRERRVIVPAAEVPGLFDKQTEAASAPKVEKRYSVSLEVDSEFMELYERAKALIGHRPMTEVLRKALTDLVEKRLPAAPKRSSPVRAPAKSTRYIPKAVRAEVYRRDGAQCTFVSASGHRCQETAGLEYDHVIPYALGGRSTAQNLRLTCRAHNQLFGEQVFGQKVSMYRRHGGGDSSQDCSRDAAPRRPA